MGGISSGEMYLPGTSIRVWPQYIGEPTGPYGLESDGHYWNPAKGTYTSTVSPYGADGVIVPTPSAASGSVGGSGAGVAGGSFHPSTGGSFHPPTFSAPAVDPNADLERDLLRNQVATTAPGYTAPLSAAQSAANALAAQQLAATTALGQGQLGISQGELGLSTSKFNQTVKDRSGAMAALERLFGSGASTTGTAAGGAAAADPDPIDPSTGLTTSEANAQRAALTQAKDRGGERLASSMRSLNGMMAERGITGSGIQGANMRGLVQQNLSDQQSTENQLIQGRAARAATLADWTRNRGASVEDRNYAAAQAQKAQEVNALMGIYGMSY